MAEVKENLNALFDPTGAGLPPDILGVLESIQRLYSLSSQELFFKWESYCLKMGSEETKLDLDTSRMFQKDVQDALERSNQGKQVRGSERKSNVSATPRAAQNGDVFGMLDELTPNTLPRKMGSVKRKSEFETPAPRKVSRPEGKKTPGEGMQGVPFTERVNPGQVLESLNEHLATAEAPIAPFSEPRLKVVANTDIKKFGYRPMSMRLSESSEGLDERIDDFISLIQKHHGLEDSAFGSAAAQSTNEIVAVGRIATDTAESKLNAASLVLEMSRRMGAGLRVQLKVDSLPSYQFFPGQIVAVRGTNASGLYFTVKEILSGPQQAMPVSAPSTIDAINEKLDVSEDSSSPLNIMYAPGPYTADDNLDFEPLQALCTKASEDMVDALILTGPFLDIEHPMLASGDFDVPDIKNLDAEASMTTIFRLWISTPLSRLASAVPNITILMIPSVRDAASKHVAWPQEQLTGKKALGLPPQVKLLPNPCFISLNEVVVGISTLDILYELSREQLSHGTTQDLLTRLPGYVIEQRHFFPLFPPMSVGKGGKGGTGACLDLGYAKLGEWLNVKPDVLVLPGMLTAGVKVRLLFFFPLRFV